MNEQAKSSSSTESESKALPRRERYLREIVKHLTDPLHKRIVEAYGKGESVKSMEAELGLILTEILKDED